MRIFPILSKQYYYKSKMSTKYAQYYCPRNMSVTTSLLPLKFVHLQVDQVSLLAGATANAMALLNPYASLD